MEKVYKNINNILTPLVICGNPLSNRKNVIICITGNPGITDFYTYFCSELYRSTDLPCCVIGHAGHEESFDKNNKYLFNLKDQIEHKLAFIDNHIDKNCKIHLIGHSIGAWMILELLEKQSDLNNRISSINLLFPTIQKMAETSNGKFLNNILRKIYRFILFISTLIYLLPKCVLLYIIGAYLWIKSLPSEFDFAVMKIINPDIAANIFYLAFNEMDTVKSLNVECLQKFKHLTNVVYTSKDHWAPVEYIEDLRQFTPHLQITEACDVEHAFVLKSSKKVANLVADFIKQHA